MVATTANIDKTTRTAREMAKAQRDSYEALAENFAAAQRRSIELANDGLEFMKLQEDNARAAQEWFANGLKLLQLQQRNAEFVQGWMGDAAEVLREQTEQNVRTAEAFARGISKQQEGSIGLSRNSGWGLTGDFFSPFSYVQESMRTFQRATQQGLEATQQVARQGLQATEQGTQQGLRGSRGGHRADREVLRRTEEATRQAKLEAAVFGALKSTNYEDLSVETS